MSPVPGFPSLKAKKMRAVLRRMGYRAVPGRGHGSHQILRAEGYPEIAWFAHDSKTLAPHTVRLILVGRVGLTVEEAKEVLSK